MTRSYLNREAILSAEDRPTDEIQIPEWGDTWVRIARWSLAVQWRISRASADDQEERGRLLALVVALSLVDARGQRLFSDEDVPALAEKNFRALERIATAAMKWNGASAAEVDDLGKASANGQTADSSSGSPVPSA